MNVKNALTQMSIMIKSKEDILKKAIFRQMKEKNAFRHFVNECIKCHLDMDYIPTESPSSLIIYVWTVFRNFFILNGYSIELAAIKASIEFIELATKIKKELPFLSQDIINQEFNYLNNNFKFSIVGSHKNVVKQIRELYDINKTIIGVYIVNSDLKQVIK